MMKVYIQATIGRNVGNQPMSDQDWARYKLQLKYTLGHAIASPLNVMDGQGYWADEDSQTVAEECHAITGIIEGHHVNKIPQIKSQLAYFARRYSQDAVAVVIVPLIEGNETLVYASE